MNDSRPIDNFPEHTPRDAALPLPLEGMLVADFTHYVAGPVATMVLAELGADVVKIESPGGDNFRVYPPVESALEAGAPFLWCNRNKRSIALDLKHADGLAIARDIVARADILVENFSTGVMEKLGLGYEQMREINPGLIYCSISAYGRTGPYAQLLGFDQVAQAESGFVSMNGYADREGVRAQSVVMDLGTALMSSNAVLAAVVARHKTGRGQRVDVSLYGSALTMVGFATAQYLLSGTQPSRNGNVSNDTAPTGVFRSSDASFYISTTSTAIFRKLFGAIGRPDIAEQDDLQTVGGRLKRREELLEILQDAFGRQSWTYWAPLLREAGVAVGEVRTVAGALESDTTKATGLVTRVAHPTGTAIPNVALPFLFSETPIADPVAAPRIGEHGRDVLRDLLGMDDARIEDLASARAVSLGTQ